MDGVAGVATGVFLFLALCAALALVTVTSRNPRALPLSVAGGLVVFGLIVVAVVPVTVPTIPGVLVALLAATLAVVGGNPFTRWVLLAADGGRTPEGSRGGILIDGDGDASGEEILRGGTTIGYLERAGATLGILAGFPAVIAVMVALKGIGRFAELATPAARERFIVGTLASLLWACATAGLAALAIR